MIRAYIVDRIQKYMLVKSSKTVPGAPSTLTIPLARGVARLAST